MAIISNKRTLYCYGTSLTRVAIRKRVSKGELELKKRKNRKIRKNVLIKFDNRMLQILNTMCYSEQEKLEKTQRLIALEAELS